MISNFLRRVDLVSEVCYAARTKFARVRHNCKSMAPRVPVSTTLTVKTDVKKFFVGDLIALRSPTDGSVLVRSVAATPGTTMVSSLPGDEPFNLSDSEYWVHAIQPDAVDSSSFGPVDANFDIIGRAVHCSATTHYVNNSEPAKVDDAEMQWLVPLVPETAKDVASLWSRTSDANWVRSALPDAHPLLPELTPALN